MLLVTVNIFSEFSQAVSYRFAHSGLVRGDHKFVGLHIWHHHLAPHAFSQPGAREGGRWTEKGGERAKGKKGQKGVGRRETTTPPLFFCIESWDQYPVKIKTRPVVFGLETTFLARACEVWHWLIWPMICYACRQEVVCPCWLISCNDEVTCLTAVVATSCHSLLWQLVFFVSPL